jgi:hypothetical protein
LALAVKNRRKVKKWRSEEVKKWKNKVRLPY